MAIRSDWTRNEIQQIFQQPLLDLVYQAATVHRKFHDSREVQRCTLLSIKTGGCSEDCSYCPQAARYQTAVTSSPLLSLETVIEAASQAKESGSSRFCMGAAWRQVKDNAQFDQIIEMVKAVNDLDLEVCCTLGMLTPHQAQRLSEAGVYAYNHNIDTSSEYYSEVITTRNYDDRLQTLSRVRQAGMRICSGGIIGLGESVEDRVGMLHTLATLPTHPESVPINALVPVEGTPLAQQTPVSGFEMARTIATARCVMPASTIRLSAGRLNLSMAEQAFCFMAGANSIFTGDRLLTTPNPEVENDDQLFALLDLIPRPAFRDALESSL